MLYVGLTKAEVTTLFLIRTEIININTWLAAIRILNILPAYPYN